MRHGYAFLVLLAVSELCAGQVVVKERVVVPGSSPILDATVLPDSSVRVGERGSSQTSEEDYTRSGRRTQAGTCGNPYGMLSTGEPPAGPVYVYALTPSADGTYVRYAAKPTHPGPFPFEFAWGVGTLHNITYQKVTVSVRSDSEVSGQFVNACGDVVSELVDSAIRVYYYPPHNDEPPRFVPNEPLVFGGGVLNARFDVELEYRWAEDRDEDGFAEQQDTTFTSQSVIAIRPPAIEAFRSSSGGALSIGIRPADALSAKIPDSTAFQFTVEPNGVGDIAFTYDGQTSTSLTAPFVAATLSNLEVGVAPTSTATAGPDGCVSGDVSVSPVGNYGLQPETVTFEFCSDPVILADRNNDGAVDSKDAGPQALPALLALNDDDDDADGVPDLEVTGTTDTDLEPLTLTTALASSGVGSGVLETLSGASSLRMWADAGRAQEVALPYTVDMGTLPLTLYAEGTAWDSTETALRFSIGGAADTLRFYVAPLGLSVPEETRVGDDLLATLSGFPLGTSIDLEVTRNGVPVSNSTVLTGDLSEVLQISTSGAAIGDIYQIAAEADSVAVDASSTIVPGEPDTVVATAPSYGSVVDVTVEDSQGNPVEDGTPVWLDIIRSADLADDTTTTDVALMGLTSEGTAQIPLPESLTLETTYRAYALAAESDTVFSDPPRYAFLTSDVTSLDVVLGESATLELFANQEDGTEVFWTVSEAAPGSPTAFTTTLQGGRSTLIVNSLGSSVGDVVVTATAGPDFVRKTLTFTASAPVWTEVDHRALAGDVAGPQSVEEARGDPIWWTEDFRFLPDGTVEDTGPTPWAADTSGVDPSGTAGVSTGAFEVRGTVSEVTWVSGPIALGAGTSADLFVAAESFGGPTASGLAPDYLALYYQNAQGQEFLLMEHQGGFDGGMGPPGGPLPPMLRQRAQEHRGERELGRRRSSGDFGVLYGTVLGDGSPIRILVKSRVASDTSGYRLFDVSLMAPPAEGNAFTYQLDTDIEPIDGGPLETVRSRPIELYSASAVEIMGSPNTSYTVALSDPASSGLAEILGLAPDGTVVTDANGEAEVWIRSTGALTLPDSLVALRVEFTVTAASGPAARTGLPDSWSDYVYLAPQSIFARTKDMGFSFFGADPQTAYGVAAAFTGGMLGVADVGALVKNGWRASPFSDEDVNELEVVLSGLGLVTEFAVGIGEAPDAPISAVKGVVAFAGNGPFSRALVWSLRRVLANGRDAAQLAKFATELATKPGFLTAARETFTSNRELSLAVRATDAFGDTYTGAVDAAVRACARTSSRRTSVAEPGSWDDLVVFTAAGPRGPPSVGARTSASDVGPCGISTRGIRVATSLFADLPQSARAVFQTLDQTDPERSVALAHRFVNAIQFGRLPEDVVRRMFDNDIFAPGGGNIPTSYTAEDLIEDLATVAEAIEESEIGRAGFLTLARTIGNTGTGRYGFRYELEAAAHLVRTVGGQPFFVSRRYYDEATGQMLTDVDVIMNNVAYQVKRSYSALTPRRGGIARNIADWVTLVRSEIGIQEVTYIVPDGVIRPGLTADETLKSLDATWIPVDFK